MCHQEKKLELNFSKSKKSKGGYQTCCKECLKDKFLLYRETEEGREKVNESSRKHREKPLSIWKKYQEGAKKRGRVFELTLEYLTGYIGKPCFYCGDPLRIPGIDRLDNDKGYTVENTVPCCSICNFMKYRYSPDLFIVKCKKISENLGKSDD